MKTILLLHGAMGSAAQLDVLKEMLSSKYHVHSIDFAGHGGRELPGEMSIQFFAEEVLQWIKDSCFAGVNIFGYSMGGYVALYLAIHQPGLVESVVTLGTKLKWDEATATKEAAMLQPTIIEQKVPKFADQLKAIHHPEDWRKLMNATADMLTKMGAANPILMQDFRRLSAKVLLMLGDRDKMVSIDETVAVFKELPLAQLAVLPNTPHAIEQADAEMIANLVKKFVD